MRPNRTHSLGAMGGRFVTTKAFAGLVGAATMLAAFGLAAQPPIASRDPSLTRLQKRIVADLSGYQSAQRSEEGVSRSTPADRARAAAFLADALAQLGLTPQRHDYRLPNVNPLVDLLLAPYRGTNVYTVVEATTPSSEYVLVGAHYDSEPGSPGAGDNAAGVALVYALAHKLAKLEPRSLNFMFVFFDQEEDDEVGSKAFVRFLQNESYAVHSVHITDLAGWHKDGAGTVEVQSPGPYLEQQYQAAAERLGLRLNLTRGASSDNKSFLNAGYSTAGVFGEITRHLHKPSDTYETVDFDYLASMTALVFAVLSDLTENRD